MEPDSPLDLKCLGERLGLELGFSRYSTTVIAAG